MIPISVISHHISPNDTAKKHWLSLVLVGLRDRRWPMTNSQLAWEPMTRWLPKEKDRRVRTTTDVFWLYHLGYNDMMLFLVSWLKLFWLECRVGQTTASHHHGCCGFVQLSLTYFWWMFSCLTFECDLSHFFCESSLGGSLHFLVLFFRRIGTCHTIKWLRSPRESPRFSVLSSGTVSPESE